MIEARLEREFEGPVNAFLDLLRYETFAFTATHRRLLAGYVRMLFHRSRARQAARVGHQGMMVDALRSLRGDEKRISMVAAKQTMDLVPGGLRRLVTTDEVKAAIDHRVIEATMPGSAQRLYLHAMDTMMTFADPNIHNGEWRVIHTAPEALFVIGDAPVVTWARTLDNTLLFGQGFARPNVEVLLPVFPTACLHILPVVPRNRSVRTPSPDEVNRAQAAFATQHCFSNVHSGVTDGVLQPFFGTMRIGIDGFRQDYLDPTEQLFSFLMHQAPYHGPIEEEPA
jgi:hypothetical protein